MNIILQIIIGFIIGFVVSTALWTYIGYKNTMQNRKTITNTFEKLNKDLEKNKGDTE